MNTQENTNNWQLQTAKAKLSSLINQAQHTPQFITKHGRQSVVVLSVDEYNKSIDSNKSESFVDWIKKSPAKGLELNLVRDKDSSIRNIEL